MDRKLGCRQKCNCLGWIRWSDLYCSAQTCYFPAMIASFGPLSFYFIIIFNQLTSGLWGKNFPSLNICSWLSAVSKHRFREVSSVLFSFQHKNQTKQIGSTGLSMHMPGGKQKWDLLCKPLNSTGWIRFSPGLQESAFFISGRHWSVTGCDKSWIVVKAVKVQHRSSYTPSSWMSCFQSAGWGSHCGGFFLEATYPCIRNSFAF